MVQARAPIRPQREFIAGNKAMMHFATSLGFADLAAVVDFLASLARTGRLQLIHERWTGHLVLRRGQIVAASLGNESGRAALEGMAIGIMDGELSYSDEPVGEDVEVLVSADDRARYLSELQAERARLKSLIPSLRVTPRMVEAADTQVTVTAAALHFIPLLVAGRTLDQLAREHGLARTVRAAAELVQTGLIKLEPAPVAHAAQAVAPLPSPHPSPAPHPSLASPMQPADAPRQPSAAPVPARGSARPWRAPLKLAQHISPAEPPRPAEPKRRPFGLQAAPRPRLEVAAGALPPPRAALSAMPPAEGDAVGVTAEARPAGWLAAIPRFFGFDDTLDAPPPSLEAPVVPSAQPAPLVHPEPADAAPAPERHTPRWLGATLDFFGFDETLNAPAPDQHRVDLAV